MKNSRNTIKNSGIPSYLRHVIFERESYTCLLCGAPCTDIHHVRPRSYGDYDRNAPYNLVALCRCHHDLLHGVIWHGVKLSRQDAWLTVIEYLSDYYANSMPGMIF